MTRYWGGGGVRGNVVLVELLHNTIKQPTFFSQRKHEGGERDSLSLSWIDNIVDRKNEKTRNDLHPQKVKKKKTSAHADGNTHEAGEHSGFLIPALSAP